MSDAFYLSEHHKLSLTFILGLYKTQVFGICDGIFSEHFLKLWFLSPEIQKHKLNFKNTLESLKFLMENYITET